MEEDDDWEVTGLEVMLERRTVMARMSGWEQTQQRTGKRWEASTKSLDLDENKNTHSRYQTIQPSSKFLSFHNVNMNSSHGGGEKNIVLHLGTSNISLMP
ncbi:hypothetical protein D9611_014234 [Ephemerocybe angulata]|uniref:Uncharacterized protein n=1 Tax=Ephemerocybe angulata TaxID=980116 RepID=A0A8H5EZW2_9AGAR|nr:hypothetical protein D9611_014234 [Tulosesus angulatus]